ncbi:MAG: hypothetical protein APF76_02850 [Desulfitibacter sp. BRH_c19]|nr:MAG: hypothetical protein APF76_02850 [Desulfitibacter sp. BRH_c19]
MIKFKKMSMLLVLILALGLVISGCGGQNAEEPGVEEPQAEEEEFIVGFVYVSPAGDGGYTYAHDLGRKYLEENVPGIKTVIYEAVEEGPDAERVMTELAENGAKVIFATSFGYMDYMANVAEQYPDVVFEHCSGYKTADNMATYFGRIYEARYLSGIAAGMKTESNKIGYVGAFPIPEVVRGINAFTLGVQSVNPDATVNVVWTNTWYDPGTEKDAALSLLDMGADVIAQHQDTPGPMQAAEERGAWGISYNSDMTHFAPNAILTGPVWNWGPYYVSTVESVMDGTWSTHEYWGTMAEGAVGLAPYNEDVMTPEIIEAVEAAKAEIISGDLDVFAGPINDQSGAVKVSDGTAMTDGERLGFDWFVQGVEGDI